MSSYSDIHVLRCWVIPGSWACHIRISRYTNTRRVVKCGFFFKSVRGGFDHPVKASYTIMLINIVNTLFIKNVGWGLFVCAVVTLSLSLSPLPHPPTSDLPRVLKWLSVHHPCPCRTVVLSCGAGGCPWVSLKRERGWVFFKQKRYTVLLCRRYYVCGAEGAGASPQVISTTSLPMSQHRLITPSSHHTVVSSHHRLIAPWSCCTEVSSHRGLVALCREAKKQETRFLPYLLDEKEIILLHGESTK